MARNNLIPLLVGCAALAALFCVVSAKTETFQFTVFQQMKPEHEREVWNSGNGKLPGIVYEDKCTKSADPESEFYATIGGLYYTIFKSGRSEVIQDVSSIRFEDIGEKGGRFADSAVHLRTQWYGNGEGEDLPKQAGAIVGGSGGLSGAYGTVEFTQVEKTTIYRIDGCFSIDY